MLTPAQMASNWTWFGTGVSTIAKKVVDPKVAASVAKEVIKLTVKVAL